MTLAENLKDPNKTLKVLALDTETTTSNKGQPYDPRNFLVCISWCNSRSQGASRITPQLLEALQRVIDDADLIVGFNFKFDLHWLTKAGLKLDHKPIWDCQNAEFVITRQQQRYPSLEDCAVKYGLGNKIDVIKNEYWDKGINTDQIPWPILREYATMDAVLTYKLYEAQLPFLSGGQIQLLRLLNEDLKVLKEMETNGIIYDQELCTSRSSELQIRIDELSATLNNFYPDVPINWNSPDQLSAFLYGGIIKQEVREHVGFFKSGAKAGEPKYAKRVIEHQLPRLYEPLKGSEMSKEGIFATNADTLLKLKGKQGPLKVLLELAKLDKLNGTYYKGIPDLNAEMNWPQATIHGQFNQVVAQTGRLSCEKPNLQNFASDLQDIFVTRYEN